MASREPEFQGMVQHHDGSWYAVGTDGHPLDPDDEPRYIDGEVEE
ncbi:hypothetical protein [Nocardia donostiensis]|nr:hypothetical protein [Nocardia donostiensis]